eukprot:1158627-Pelagomonas_calceolata.AAC.6
MILVWHPGQVQCLRSAGCSAWACSAESLPRRQPHISQGARRTPATLERGTPFTSTSTPCVVVCKARVARQLNSRTLQARLNPLKSILQS